jgi:hypothetical protein
MILMRRLREPTGTTQQVGARHSRDALKGARAASTVA